MTTGGTGTSADTDTTAEAFTEQARWLVDWHNRRSESMASRAAALLGFVGVVLALLLQGATSGVEPASGVYVSLIATLVLQGASAICGVWALWPRTLVMPQPDKFLQWWAGYAAAPTATASPRPKITESLLRSRGSREESPLLSASAEATSRARAFGWAALMFILSLVPMVCLVVIVLAQSGGET